jgi:hypothetical protein
MAARFVPRLHRLDDGLAVDHDNSGSQGAGAPHLLIDQTRRHMGQFDSGQDDHVHINGILPRHGGHARQHKIHVRGIGMVGDGDGAISGHLGPPSQFGGNQLSVAERRMRMQVDHVRITSCT